MDVDGNEIVDITSFSEVKYNGTCQGYETDYGSDSRSVGLQLSLRANNYRERQDGVQVDGIYSTEGSEDMQLEQYTMRNLFNLII